MLICNYLQASSISWDYPFNPISDHLLNGHSEPNFMEEGKGEQLCPSFWGVACPNGGAMPF
jgi:hypothetical protein